MSNSGAITEVVDPISNKQVADLEKALVSLEAQFVATAKQADALVKATGGAVSFSQFTKAAKESDAATKQIIDNSEKIKASEIRLQAKRDEIAAKQETIAAKRRRVVTENTAAEIAAAQKAIATQNAMTTAVNENDIAQGRAAARAAAYKTQTQQVGAAKAITTAEISAETAAIETNTAVQASGLDKIGGQLTKGLGYLRTLAYILPGIGIAGIFTLAFGVIGKAADALGIFNDKLSLSEKNLSNFNAVTANTSKQYGEQSTNLRILYSATQDVTNSEQNRLLAAKELQKEFPSLFGNITTETILNGGAANAYNLATTAILENAKAKAAATKISELAAKQLDIEFQKQKIENARQSELSRVKGVANQLILGGGGTTGTSGTSIGLSEAEQRKVINKRADLSTALQDANKKDLQDQIDFLIKFAGGNNKIAAALSAKDNTKTPDNVKSDLNDRLKTEKELEDKVLQNDESFIQARLDAITKYYTNSKAIIQAGIKSHIFSNVEGKNLLLSLDNDVAKDRQKIAKDGLKELADLEKEYNTQIDKARRDDAKNQKDIQENSKDTAKQYAQQRLQANQDDANDALQALSEQYAKGLISTKEYQKQKKDIETQANLESIKIQIEGIEFLLEVEKKTGADTAEDERKLADLKRRYSKEATDAQIADNERLKADEKELADKRKELADDVGAFFVAVINAGYTNQINRIQDEKDALTVKTKNEIDAVDRSALSQEDKANKIAVINAKASAQQDALDMQRRQVQEKQAKFDKAVSIAKIVENTLIAASAAGWITPLAILIEAIGAVQVATLLATPIPKFEHGGTMKKTGLAAFGHGTELRIDPDGTQSFTPSTETIGMVKAGTKFISNKDLVNMIARPEKINFAGGQVDDKLLDEMRKVNSHLAKAKPVHGTILTSKGVKGYVTNTEKWNNYVRRNIN